MNTSKDMESAYKECIESDLVRSSHLGVENRERDSLLAAQFVVVGLDIALYLNGTITEHLNPDVKYLEDGALNLDIGAFTDSSLPFAGVVFFDISVIGAKSSKTFAVVKNREGYVEVVFWVNGGTSACAFKPGSAAVYSENFNSVSGKWYGWVETTDASKISQAFFAATTITILNEKKFITHTPAPRSTRRRMQKISGNPEIKYTKVSWNIGETIKSEIRKSDPKNATALHFCRAHWRHAKEGQPKARERNDADGWWCWVNSCWRGHPAFGIVRHIYTPKMPA